ncbi:hypothetical protein KN10_2682 [Anoxybacillus flavithermus NBRC 109594]|uniref:Uncharacterized protein n=1 Tax=Anoxybacillus flavithermus NBRC 109594 TaxID=1315967 RepID=R4FFK1_9BACL|nr:hypothetical protein KN10_2682 [Anoxybacillus flavithermus NBRC 109594]
MNNGTITRLVIADGLRRYRNEAVYTLAVIRISGKKGGTTKPTRPSFLGRVFLFLKKE